MDFAAGIEGAHEVTPWGRVTYSAALLIGLTLGAFFGFQDSVTRLNAHHGFKRMSPMLLGAFSYLQYRQAETGHAKAALLTYVNVLEEMEKLRPEDSQKRELANAYTRLALLEDAAESAEQSRAYMARARYWYTATGAKEYSDSEMKAALQQMDAKIDELKDRIRR